VSKRPSGANSRLKPPDPPVFFLDRSLGKHIVATALRSAGVAVEIRRLVEQEKGPFIAT